MGWLLGGFSLVFGYISLSMFVAAFKEKDEQERFKLMRSGLGTLVLALMGFVFAWYSFHPAPPPGH